MEDGSTRLESYWVTLPAGLMHAYAALHEAAPGAPTAVLVHGLVLSSRYLLPTALELAPSCCVYAPDLPGYGRSYKPPRALDVSELAEVLADWMRQAGLSRSILVGNSFGCQVVAACAVRYPELVERAVLTAPVVDPRHHSSVDTIARFLLDLRVERPSLLPIGWKDMVDIRPHRAWQTFGSMMQAHIERNLPRIQAPTLVVYGTADPLVPRRWAEEAARFLPRGELSAIPGGSHALPYSVPEELGRVLRPFLAGELAPAHP